MKILHSLTALIFFSGTLAVAANLAVIDSGVDYKHKDLSAKIWTNPNTQTTDDEGTVYKDDTHGWNFAEKNNSVIDYKYLGTFSADCKKLFKVQSRILRNKATAEEQAWYKEKKEDKTFGKELAKFGNFVHGTHVSGISSNQAASAHVIAMKLVPTEQPTLPGGHFFHLDRYLLDAPEIPGAGAMLAKLFLGMLAKKQAQMLAKVGLYTKAVNADIANGSFGVSVKAAATIVAPLLEKLLGHKPSETEVKESTTYFISQMVAECKKFAGASPKTLFVFAAGNDGTDNDSLPASPANVKADNTIAVAATVGVSRLAPFSNYGEKMVEVAAPGVAVESTIPGDEYLEMSGTSMAAPFVTNVAGVVKDANPALGPADIKRVIMETVDVKDFLKGKVSSSGIVNRARAEKAANLSLRVSLAEAISRAKAEVPDTKETLTSVRENVSIIPIPLPSIL